MIVTIAGAPGQGKGELLASLQEESYKVNILPRTIRSSSENFCDYQDRLLKDRIELVEQNLVTPETIFFEASFIDMFVYSLFTIGLNHEFSEWMDKFYNRCVNAQEALIDFSVLVPVRDNDDLGLSMQASYIFNLIVRELHERSNFAIVDLRANVDSKATVEEIINNMRRTQT